MRRPLQVATRMTPFIASVPLVFALRAHACDPNDLEKNPEAGFSSRACEMLGFRVFRAATEAGGTLNTLLLHPPTASETRPIGLPTAPLARP